MSLIALSIDQLKSICSEMAKCGVAEYKKAECNAQDRISQRVAWRTFGRVTVERWVNRGLVSRQKGSEKNSKITYSYAELLQVQSAERIQTLQIQPVNGKH